MCATVFKQYATEVTSATQAQAHARNRQLEQDDPHCCCCKATSVLIVCNSGLFLLSIAITLVGFFINNEVSGWELRVFDILGYLWYDSTPHVVRIALSIALHMLPLAMASALRIDGRMEAHRLCLTLCGPPLAQSPHPYPRMRSIITGLFLLIVSAMGIIAARTMNRSSLDAARNRQFPSCTRGGVVADAWSLVQLPFLLVRFLMFMYFMFVLLVTASLCLAVIYAFVEDSTLTIYLNRTNNWERLQEVVGHDLEFDHVNEMMHQNFYLLAGFGFAGMSVQFLSLFRRPLASCLRTRMSGPPLRCGAVHIPLESGRFLSSLIAF
jgi:hypothetical protein